MHSPKVSSSSSSPKASHILLIFSHPLYLEPSLTSLIPHIFPPSILFFFTVFSSVSSPAAKESFSGEAVNGQDRGKPSLSLYSSLLFDYDLSHSPFYDGSFRSVSPRPAKFSGERWTGVAAAASPSKAGELGFEPVSFLFQFLTLFLRFSRVKRGGRD